MRGLVIDRTRKQEYPGGCEPLAELVDIAQTGDPREPDRARGGTYPLKRVGAACKELVEQRQVALDDLEVAFQEDGAVAKGERGQ